MGAWAYCKNTGCRRPLPAPSFREAVKHEQTCLHCDTVRTLDAWDINYAIEQFESSIAEIQTKVDRLENQIEHLMPQLR